MMGNKEQTGGMKSSQKEAKEPKTGQRAPQPGDEKNAAGKSNPNKQKESGQIGSEPMKDEDINRGD